MTIEAVRGLGDNRGRAEPVTPCSMTPENNDPGLYSLKNSDPPVVIL